MVQLIVCFGNQCLLLPQAGLQTQDRSLRIPPQVVTTAKAVLRLAVASVVSKEPDLQLESTVLVLQVQMVQQDEVGLKLGKQRRAIGKCGTQGWRYRLNHNPGRHS